MSISKEQITAVKGRGFLQNRGTECFSGRVVSVAGQFAPDALRAIADCAEKFGSGKVIFTSRLAAEIVGIPFDNIPQAEAFLAERGLYFGGTGAKVRPITGCKGTTCIYGNIDTQQLAQTIHDKFYIGMRDVKLPHKFKIGVGGCPNSCMKPSLNDVGIEGCKAFSFDATLCRGCKKCAITESCPSKAVSVVDGKAVVDESKCTKCGVCVGKCPFGAAPKEAKSACRIFVGGTWGKKQRMGTLLSGTYTEAEVPEMIEKVMLWFKENAYAKERLGAAIDRIGVAQMEAALATNDLLDRKDEILAKPLLER
ncbi:MAG: (4Fe-4S)-binding protein [Ruminococcaceae bacterium]|nr:(4Fe-4S)-binding protein [Oscillospiraceae bacterium]